MLIALLKFFHLICILGLTSAIIYSMTLVISKKFALHNSYHHGRIHRLNRVMMWLATFAILTGTMLVYPKHFTFHTVWIQTAYVLILLFTLIVGVLIMLAKKNPRQTRWVWLLAYLMLAVILLNLIHDAVTKHTLL